MRTYDDIETFINDVFPLEFQKITQASKEEVTQKTEMADGEFKQKLEKIMNYEEKKTAKEAEPEDDSPILHVDLEEVLCPKCGYETLRVVGGLCACPKCSDVNTGKICWLEIALEESEQKLEKSMNGEKKHIRD